MQVNRTASYSPSYTANYGEAQRSKSRNATKVTYNHSPESKSGKSVSWQAKVNQEDVQKVGLRLNAKA